MKMEEISFQVSLENCQGFSIPDRVGKFIPPARNDEWNRSGEWFCASLWWHHEASLSRRSQTSGGNVLSSVSGSRRVLLSLWLFYMQASVSWTWCKLQPGASAGRQRRVQGSRFKRVVTWALLGSLKTNRAAAFRIIFKCLIVRDGSPARSALQ